MKVEIISTGEEIVTGAVVDSNSAFLADRLMALGVDVVRHSSVGDEASILSGLFREVGERSDVAVVTGGLGPTRDDLTADAAARAAGVGLCHDSGAEATVRRYFEAKGMGVTPSNLKQALLPEGAGCLGNAVGTAPGFSLVIGGCTFFFLPGVPHEMRHMFQHEVVPRLVTMQGGEQKHNELRTLSLFGLPEAAVGERLDGMEDRFQWVRLGLRARFPVIQVKLYGAGFDREEVNAELDRAALWVKERVGEYVFSDNGESMAFEAGRLLRERGETVAFAESCTGGLIGHMVTDVAGSSDYFLLSAVTYSNPAKERVLGVSGKTIEAYGAVSEETVREMAAGARRAAGSDYGVATSGIAGPGGGTPGKPVGTVCIGIAWEGGVTSVRFVSPIGERRRNKELFAVKALDLLRRTLLEGRPARGRIEGM